MNIQDRIKTAEGKNLNKEQLIRFLYEPILRAFKYPLDDIFKMEKSYLLDDQSNLVIDYAYVLDNKPIIAVLLEDEFGGKNMDGELDNLFVIDSLRYVLILNGVRANLYYKDTFFDHFELVVTSDLTKGISDDTLTFSPEYILDKDGNYWQEKINNKMYNEISRNKDKYKDIIIKLLNRRYPNNVSSNNIDKILEIILGTHDSPKPTVESLSNMMMLSDIEYDTDFRNTTINSVIIGNDEYGSMSYINLFRELVQYMETFVNQSNIDSIQRVSSHKGTCQMKNKPSGLSPSYKNSHVSLGHTYIGETGDTTILINTTKRLFDVLGINQDNVLLEWVSNESYNEPVDETVDEPDGDIQNSPLIIKRVKYRYMLSEIGNTNEFVSTRIKKAVLFGKEYPNMSYRELSRKIIQRINKTISNKDIDRELLKGTVRGMQIVQNHYELSEANKKRHIRLGNYYVGLNYDVKSTLTTTIDLCELFDINQDEIIIYIR